MCRLQTSIVFERNGRLCTCGEISSKRIICFISFQWYQPLRSYKFSVGHRPNQDCKLRTCCAICTDVVFLQKLSEIKNSMKIHMKLDTCWLQPTGSCHLLTALPRSKEGANNRRTLYLNIKFWSIFAPKNFVKQIS